MNLTPTAIPIEARALVPPSSQRFRPVPAHLEPVRGNPERHPALKLQLALQRLLRDSTSSQSEVFNACVPVAAFLYLLLVGMAIPRWVRDDTGWFAIVDVEGFSSDSTAVAAVLPLISGLFGVLTILRLSIWLGAAAVRELARQDLEPIFGSGELSHTNLALGAFLN